MNWIDFEGGKATAPASSATSQTLLYKKNQKRVIGKYVSDNVNRANLYEIVTGI